MSEFIVKFRTLPWKRQTGGFWTAAKGRFFYNVSHFGGTFEMYDATGKNAVNENGQWIKRHFNGWISWPYDDPVIRRQRDGLGPGFHPTCLPYVTGQTATDCMNLVDKVHQKKIAEHLEKVA